MSNIKSRLSRHFVASAAIAAASAGVANAAIVWSGPVNINIPATTAGVYLNVVTGVSATSPAGAPGWDINPWSSTGFGLFNATPGASSGYLNLGGNLFNLPGGTSIGPGGNFVSLAPATNNPQWNLNSANNLIGFRFLNEAGNTVHFGWFRVEFGSTITNRSIVEYAFESTPETAILAGAIPAPGALALLGLSGLVGARRRRA